MPPPPVVEPPTQEPVDIKIEGTATDIVRVPPGLFEALRTYITNAHPFSAEARAAQPSVLNVMGFDVVADERIGEGNIVVEYPDGHRVAERLPRADFSDIERRVIAAGHAMRDSAGNSLLDAFRSLGRAVQQAAPAVRDAGERIRELAAQAEVSSREDDIRNVVRFGVSRASNRMMQERVNRGWAFNPRQRIR